MLPESPPDHAGSPVVLGAWVLACRMSPFFGHLRKFRSRGFFAARALGGAGGSHTIPGGNGARHLLISVLAELKL